MLTSASSGANLFFRLSDPGVRSGGRRGLRPRRLRRPNVRFCGPFRMAHAGQPGMRQHGQGHVAVPGAVEADLIVIEPGLVLGLGEAVLDGLITNGKFCCVRR